MAKKHNILPRLWVLLSMIALSLFLVYWNYSNYQSEKKQLKQNLESQLQLAYTEVMDSVFVEEIIVMAKVNNLEFDLTNKSAFNLPSNLMKIGDTEQRILPDSIHRKLKYIDLNENPSFRDSFKIITYSDDLNTQAHAKIKRDSLINFTFKTDSLVFESGGFMESDQISLVLENLFTAKIDHKPEIESTFRNKIESLGFPSEFTHINSSQSGALPVYYVGDREYDIPISLGINNYKSYLWKALASPILFSLLLLAIVGIAFWSLLSSWTKQQKLIEIKNEFISNMTHELKTPISTVGVALEAISGFDLTKEEAKTKEYIDISRHELNRLSLLVDKVLKMASYEGANEVMKKEAIDLANTTEGILQSMKLHLENKGATVNYNNTSTHSTVIGDKVHITNVIYNIIDNAMKYSDDRPIIDIQLSESKEDVVLKIKDHGKGIPKEYLGKIFDRFFRVPTSDRHNVKGHGLGLSYVQDVINTHKGEITADSELGQGTTFSITLPKSEAHA